MKGLKQRWGVTSNWQLAIIFVVFAITGSASAWLSKPFCEWLDARGPVRLRRDQADR